MRAGSNISFFDDDGGRRLIGRERNGIASALGSNRLAVDGRSTILADYAVRAFVESHAATNFAGVKYGGDFSVVLLIKPKTDFSAVFLGGQAMKIAIRNLRQRNTRLSIRERNRSGRGQRTNTLGKHKYREDEQDQQ